MGVLKLEVNTISDKKSRLYGAKYYKKLSEKMKTIHSEIPNDSYNLEKIASVDVREEHFEGKNCKRLVMYLMSNGCEWALKSGHGCLMCGHIAKQTRKDEIISSDKYIKQFKDEFEKYDFKEYPILNLYNNGSFINDNEIAPEARNEILRMINDNPHIKMLVIETRPEFVTEERIVEIKNIMTNTRVEVAIGLEMHNDMYRYICVNKGFSLLQYEKAAKIIVKHLHLRTYVMLKPVFLTERESIDECIKTIEYVFSIGASTVSLETCTVQDYTLVSYLNNKNKYSTAWLWSIIEVVNNVSHLGKVIVGMFQFYPSADKVPYNCNNCSDDILERLIQYNKTLDCKCLKDVDCDCKSKWIDELKKEDIKFEDRIIELLE